ncbi:hypothetical protein BJF84_21475 [Rhodococcus sp. CUA-806]|nr:hypothetical protein BJF84_21475 [Rhodococcus sp. CUA-806]
MTDSAPVASERISTPTAAAPDVLRCAYMELVVTDLERSRAFYVDVLGLVVTEEDEDAVYLRSFEEFIHHNLVLRRGPVAGVAAFSYRVRSPEDLDAAVAFYTELGCRVERRAEGFTKASAIRSGWRIRWAFRTSSSTTSSTWKGLPGTTTSIRPERWCGWIISTRSPRTFRAPCGTWRTSGSA